MFATDQILLVNNPDLACDMSIAAWISIGVFLCVGKAIVAVGHSLLWLQRRAKLRKAKKRSDGRFPIVPLLSWLLLIVYVLIFTTSPANIPGLGPCLFGIGWTFWATQALFFAYKFVSLGHRIVHVKTGNIEKHAALSLSKLDLRGKLTFISALITLFGQALCFCVLIFVFPKSYLIIQLGFGISGWCTLNIGFLLINHFNRVIRAVSESQRANENIATSETSREMRRALSKLREQRIGSFIPITLSVIFHILIAANAIPARYFLFPITMLIETAGFLFIMTSNLKSQINSKCCGANKAVTQSDTISHKNENREQLTAVISSNPQQGI